MEFTEAPAEKRKKVAKDKDELWAQIQEEWENLKGGLLERLAESMPQRCQDVIAGRGGPTHHSNTGTPPPPLRGTQNGLRPFCLLKGPLNGGDDNLLMVRCHLPAPFTSQPLQNICL